MSSSSPPPKKTILILGGSYAGLSVAHYILKHVLSSLPESSSYRVLLISASSQAMCRPACPRALISDTLFDQTKLFVDIQKQFDQYPDERFEFIAGRTTELDHVNKSVTVTLVTSEAVKVEYHALVIATGAATPSPLLGLNVNSDSLRKSWATFREALPSAKHIVIAGGGPAGIETAGELGEYLNGRAGYFSSRLEDPKVKIAVVTASKILPLLRPSIAARAETYLAKVGVAIMKDARITSVEPVSAGSTPELVATKTTVKLENGKTLDADLYIPATGMVPNTGFISKDLLQTDGRVDTDSTLRVPLAGQLVFALGDVSSYARPAVHNILAGVPVLCSNLKRNLLLAAGKTEGEVGPERKFEEDKRETQLVPIGRSKGVGAAMGWRVPSWMVWAVKGRDYWLGTTGGLWSGKQWAKEV